MLYVWDCFRPSLKLRKVWERLYTRTTRTFRTNTILKGQGWKMSLLFPHFVTLLKIQPVTARKLTGAALTTL
jgi:hypothetical protein